LLYAFNSEDEVAPAQSLASFAKTAPNLKFVGAISADGTFINAQDVKALAGLPGKNQMVASVIATLNVPINDTISGLSNGLSTILSSIEARLLNNQ
jgi:large subunit ribosomal protein L10